MESILNVQFHNTCSITSIQSSSYYYNYYLCYSTQEAEDSYIVICYITCPSKAGLFSDSTTNIYIYIMYIIIIYDNIYYYNYNPTNI